MENERTKNFRRSNIVRVSKLIFPGGIILLTLVLTGCQWVGFTSHTTPQVSGRVMDAATGRPLAGVKILRVMHGQVENPSTPPYGATMFQQERPVVTDARGDFVYRSESYMTLLREARWWSLKLAFQSAGHATWQTNFTMTNVSTNLPDGTPVVEAGEIFLEPLSGGKP